MDVFAQSANGILCIEIRSVTRIGFNVPHLGNTNIGRPVLYFLRCLDTIGEMLREGSYD